MTPAEAADLARASIATERPPPPSTVPPPDPPSDATPKAWPTPGRATARFEAPGEPHEYQAWVEEASRSALAYELARRLSE